MTDDTKDQAPDGVAFHVTPDDEAEDTEGHVSFHVVESGEGPDGVSFHAVPTDDEAPDGVV
jgi:hypothetical protein